VSSVDNKLSYALLVSNVNNNRSLAELKIPTAPAGTSLKSRCPAPFRTGAKAARSQTRGRML
jgi:hypothetical protein